MSVCPPDSGCFCLTFLDCAFSNFEQRKLEIDHSHVTCLFASLTVGAVKRHEQDTLHPDKGQLSPSSKQLGTRQK